MYVASSTLSKSWAIGRFFVVNAGTLPGILWLEEHDNAVVPWYLGLLVVLELAFGFVVE